MGPATLDQYEITTTIKTPSSLPLLMLLLLIRWLLVSVVSNETVTTISVSCSQCLLLLLFGLPGFFSSGSGSVLVSIFVIVWSTRLFSSGSGSVLVSIFVIVWSTRLF